MIWAVFVLLVLLILAFALSGYLLPWDQKAYWATTVTINIGRSSPLIGEYLADVLTSPFEPVPRVIADERSLIEQTLRDLCDTEHCCLVITTGGTGPALRDVTPEATEAVCQKMMPGFGELMRKVSLEKVPTAILSRQTAGICGRALIVNLPGQPKAIKECLDAVFPAIPYCIDLLEGPYLTTDETKIKAFRPKKQVNP